MKKILLTTALVVGMATSASAIPFQIADTGTIGVQQNSGLGISSYSSLGSDIINLQEGETSEVIDFFDVYFIAGSEGTATATINFLTPTLTAGSASDTGDYSVFGFSFIISILDAEIKWGEPEQFDYSFGNLHNGTMLLDLLDIDFKGVMCGPLTISGTITNVADPVPEPGTMMLFGAGLAGLAGLGRRRK